MLRLVAFTRALWGDPFRDAWGWWTDEDTGGAVDQVHAYNWGWTQGARLRARTTKVHSKVL